MNRIVCWGTLVLPALLFPFVVGSAEPARERPDFDWIGVAPIVVRARVEKAQGRLPRLTVIESIRGEALTADRSFRIDLWLANDRKAEISDLLSLDIEAEYLLLLRPSPRRPRRGEQVFELIRGVGGIREIPPERGEAMLAAVREFVAIQSRHDDEFQWQALRAHLANNNLWLVDNSLAMHIRFLRGDPALIASIVPLFDHPRPTIRAQAAELVAETISLFPAVEYQEKYFGLHSRLSALARADDAPSVREQAVVALDRLNDEGAAILLETIAKTDPDQRVRLAAATRLLGRREAAGDSH